jgi:CelD/BcsL family acetyltransferase involved in cellulose biosynthesis
VGERVEVTNRSDADGFEAFREEWAELELRAAEDNIFLTYQWQHTWWAEFGEGRQLELIAFREAGGRLVGLAPAYRELIEGFSIVRFGGGLEVTDYLGLVVEPGYELAVGRAFLEYCRQSADLVLDFHYLRSDGATLKALREAADSLGLDYGVEQEDVSPRILIDGDWEQHVARLTKKDRHELRRKRRRMEDAGGWEVVEATGVTIAKDLETFFDLHAKSTHAKADFLTDEMKAFFRHICVHLQKEGWLSLRTLRLEGRPAAAVLGFVYGGKLLLYNSGYDPEYNRLSPGFVLMSEEVRLAIAAGLSEVDFLRGNEKYKYDLGATALPLMHLAVLTE